MTSETAAKPVKTEHYRKLEQMYLAAPINAFYSPSIWISHGEAEVSIAVRPEFFHAADAVHGSVYFKLLDDAAFFAVNSMIEDYFALTASFTTYLLRAVTEGTMKATGKVVWSGGKSYIADAVVVDGDGREVARGNGNFVASKIRLTSEMGYRI